MPSKKRSDKKKKHRLYNKLKTIKNIGFTF